MLPGYRVSRSSIHVTDYGLKHGCHEPQLGRARDGSLAYWVNPIGLSFSIFIRLEGLKRFFDDAAQSKHREGGTEIAGLV